MPTRVFRIEVNVKKIELAVKMLACILALVLFALLAMYRVRVELDKVTPKMLLGASYFRSN